MLSLFPPHTPQSSKRRTPEQSQKPCGIPSPLHRPHSSFSDSSQSYGFGGRFGSGGKTLSHETNINNIGRILKIILQNNLILIDFSVNFIMLF